jgi:uncharacterized protein
LVSLSLPLNLTFFCLSQIHDHYQGANLGELNLKMGIMMGLQIMDLESKISAATATAEALLEIGMKYCIGREVSQNYVLAHKWFNLAAMKGSESAKEYRCEISREMSPSDVADAQRQARAWLTLH